MYTFRATDFPRTRAAPEGMRLWRYGPIAIGSSSPIVAGSDSLVTPNAYEILAQIEWSGSPGTRARVLVGVRSPFELAPAALKHATAISFTMPVGGLLRLERRFTVPAVQPGDALAGEAYSAEGEIITSTAALTVTFRRLLLVGGWVTPIAA